MPKWISIDEAAHKYGVKEEDICLWAEMEAITAYFTETTLIIDEKSLQRFMYLRKNLPTTGYIRTLEQLCINQSEVCKLYMESKAESGWWEKLWMKISNRQKL